MATKKIAFKEIPLKCVRPDHFDLQFVNHCQITSPNAGEVQIFFGRTIVPPYEERRSFLEVKQTIGIAMTSKEFLRLFDLMERYLPNLEVP